MRKHYSLTFLVSFIILLSGAFSLKAQYCMPSFTNYCTGAIGLNDYIDNFSTTGGISNITNNATGCTGTFPNNYTYYSTMTVAQVQGQSFNISMQCGAAYSQGFRVWIDYNNDNDFNGPGEDVFNAPTGFAPVGGTVLIPMTTTPGVKRMRVLCRFSTTPGVTDYCGTNFAYGECEDYNVNVIAATPCSGMPTGGTAVASSTTPCGGDLLTVGLTGSSLTGGLLYQWLQGTNCVGPWIPINCTTNPSACTPTLSLTTVPGTTRGYRCRVTCSFSGLSDTSAMTCVTTAPWSCNSTCYLSSSATSGPGNEIFNVSLNSLNNTTDCTNPLTGTQGVGAGTANQYVDFGNGTGAVPAPQVYQGLVTPFSVTIGTCNTFSSSVSTKVYIDFNHNTSFLDPGEMVHSSTGTTTMPSTVLTGSFTAPVSPAITGCTKMRVITSTSTVINPEGLYTDGETEDYNLNIITPGPTDPAITAINVPAGTCFTNNETVTATLCNYGSTAIDLSVNPVTVSLHVSGATTTTYTMVASSGILTSYGGQCVPVTFSGVNLYNGGGYSINTSLTISGIANANLANDSLGAGIIRANYRPTPGADYHMCEGNIIPFGQGLTVSGCATPINDSAEILFVLAPGQPPICTSTLAVPTNSCEFASAILPALPAGSTITSSGTLTVTNLASAFLGCIACTWPNEKRFSLYQGTAPPSAGSIFHGGLVGHPGTTGANAQGYTYTNIISPTVLGNIYSALGPGGTLMMGSWNTYNTTGTTHVINYNGNPTVAKIKFYYTWVPASFEWFKDSVGGPVLYTYSPFNPIGVPGSGIINSNTPGVTPFYAACAGSSDCRVPVDLVINANPTVIQDSMLSCEYAVGGNSATFDLTQLDGPVSAFDTAYTTVTYSPVAGIGLVPPILPANAYSSSTNFIYATVTTDSTQCTSQDSVLLTVNSIPQFSLPIYANGLVCAPSAVDISSIINVFPGTGLDTLFFEDPAYTIPYPGNAHAISTADTVYLIVVTADSALCADSSQAQIAIGAATNYIANQDVSTGTSLPGAVPCGSVLIGDVDTATSYTTTDCRRIATVIDNVADGDSLGSVNICEEVYSTAQFWGSTISQPYVKRTYDISPLNNDSAIVCLYYLQDDFDDYDAVAFPNWPSMVPTSNLCITKVSGGPLGTPGNTVVSIPNSAITSTFDAASQVWTVCFPVDSFSSFYCHTCNPLNTPLPVTLRTFTGKGVGTTSVLNWVTTNEYNNSHFILERGRDPKQFSPISGMIKSKAPNGNSHVELSYDYIDETPFNGHNYYRLQQVDIDNQINYSGVVDVYFADETMVTLYPNPVTTELTIEINTPKSTTAIAKIMDAAGRLVRTVEMPLVAGVNTNKIDMQSLSDGVYLIKITNNKGLDYTQTIRKK